MATLYDEFDELALELLTEFGGDIEGVAEVYTEGSSGTDPFGNAITEDGVIISGRASPVLNYAQAEIDGDVIKQDDGYVIWRSDVNAERPSIGQLFEDSAGTKYRIQDIEKIDSPDNLRVFTKLQLRAYG
jgi:hypothetical protein